MAATEEPSFMSRTVPRKVTTAPIFGFDRRRRITSPDTSKSSVCTLFGICIRSLSCEPTSLTASHRRKKGNFAAFRNPRVGIGHLLVIGHAQGSAFGQRLRPDTAALAQVIAHLPHRLHMLGQSQRFLRRAECFSDASEKTKLDIHSFANSKLKKQFIKRDETHRIAARNRLARRIVDQAVAPHKQKQNNKTQKQKQNKPTNNKKKNTQKNKTPNQQKPNENNTQGISLR